MAENISCSVCGAQDSSFQDGDTLYSFPDARRNPVVYNNWCEVLSVDPKQEKLKKPLVCQKHFSPKDIDRATGVLETRAVPRMSLSQKDARPKIGRRSTKNASRKIKRGRGRPSISSTKHNESSEEDPRAKNLANFEKSLDDAFIEELLSDVRQMNRQQKEIFQSEMMELIIDDIL